jgi:ankyrin repeat protein
MTGQTPFLRAARAGDVTVMKLLLEHGADPNILTYGGTNALMVAAGVNFGIGETYDEGEAALLEAVKLAHSLGNDINAVNSVGLQAIHGAANRGANSIVKYLAENGAELDRPDKEGRTPVRWAEGEYLPSRPLVPKPDTIALIKSYQVAAD